LEALLSFSRLTDALSERTGKAVSWLVLIAVLVSTCNALVRYTFNYSSNAFLEIQWYLFAAIFLLGASWTLKRNEHIRIDVVVGRFSPRVHAWIDILGGLFFLLPLCIIVLYNGVPFFLEALKSGEVSSNAGGLIVWPAKLLIPIGFALLLMQGLSEIIKRIAYLAGAIDGKEFIKAGHHGLDAEEIKKEIEAIAAANKLKLDALGVDADKK
jgi:TRAP-type mannitol/chloroaromatic compound transport system permease small subunit